jgi:hypothetical protein
MADTTREGKTMAYVDSMRCLIDAGTEAGMLIGLENTNNLTALHQRIFGGPLANDIASAGYPGGIEVPWMVEELFVYSLAELSDRQAGYRYDANTNAPSVNWDCDRYVLADWGANPVSIGTDGTICYSRHGDGDWSYVPIATDLPAFFKLLAAWLRYFVVEQGSNLLDDNFEIAQDTRDAVTSTVLAETIPEYRNAAMRFLLGEI